MCVLLNIELRFVLIGSKLASMRTHDDCEHIGIFDSVFFLYEYADIFCW